MNKKAKMMANQTDDIGANSLPEVRLIDSIRPSADSAKSKILEYPKLKAEVLRQKPLSKIRRRLLGILPENSIAWMNIRAQQQMQKVLGYAYKIQCAKDEAIERSLSERFTSASKDLYGAPSLDLAYSLALDDIRHLRELANNPGIDQQFLKQAEDFYAKHVSMPMTLPVSKDYSSQQTEVMNAIKSYMTDRFGDVLAAVAEGHSLQETISPEIIARQFKKGLAVLQAQDNLWNDWKVITEDVGLLVVRSACHQIVVGIRREPMDVITAQGKFAHEVLVHALRQVNAERFDDQQLRIGLARYSDAEEGFACLVEFSVSGRVSRRLTERYVDIAFALGLLDGQPVARKEMFDMALARRVVFKQANGRRPNIDSLANSTWEHINRIYRGTRGGEIVGVFTKDVVYYDGLRKIIQYIHTDAKEKPITEVMDYLLCCKFDPTNLAHTGYVANFR